VGPTELELSLRLELASLERELTRAKLEAEEARVQYEWLREEVQKTRCVVCVWFVCLRGVRWRLGAAVRGGG